MNTRTGTIIFEVLLPNGMAEAVTGDGVAGVQLTEFWSTFYFKRCNGNKLKVPSISPDVTAGQWEADARVFTYGVIKFCLLSM